MEAPFSSGTREFYLITSLAKKFHHEREQPTFVFTFPTTIIRSNIFVIAQCKIGISTVQSDGTFLCRAIHRDPAPFVRSMENLPNLVLECCVSDDCFTVKSC